MKKLFVILPVIAGVLIFAGCGKKAELTKATEVTNPPEQPAQVQAPPSKPLRTAVDDSALPQQKVTSSKDGFVTTKSGLQYKDKVVGKGAAVKAGDSVTVNYTGWLDNGKVFDTSKKVNGEPFSFTVGGGQVIRGWDEGLQGMKAGGNRELKVPANLGYGSDEMGEIPPNSTLHFEVELLKINK